MDGAFIWRQFWYKPESQDVPVPTGFCVVPTEDFAERPEADIGSMVEGLAQEGPSYRETA